MPIFILHNKVRMLTIFFVVVICLFLPNLKPIKAGTEIGGYLWSATAGWISMSCSNGATCATSDYSVEIGAPEFFVNASTGRTHMKTPINGFAWSNNLGWICFGDSCDAQLDKLGNPILNPEGAASNYTEWVQTDPDFPDGKVFGWARLLSEGAGGWISLNCDNHDPAVKVCDPIAGTGFLYYVALDSDSGFFCEAGECDDPVFPNPAFPGHWAWSGNERGTGIGWVDWSLAETQWKPPFIGVVLRPQGIFEPANSPIPGTHPSDYEITVEEVYSPPDYMLRCDLLKPNGDISSVARVFSGGPVNGSDEIFFGSVDVANSIKNPADPGQDPIQVNTLWFIESCYLTMDPTSDTCMQDSDCPPDFVCDRDVVGAVGPPWHCREPILRTSKRPFYVHHNDWTLFNLDEDFYQAVKCYTQFEGEFFQNSARCDFMGDATFGMAMNKSIPIERNCVNGIDDDLNGLTDCMDPFCLSLAVTACIEHEALDCNWDEAPANIGRCNSVQYKTGDICCTLQNKVVSGMECKYNSASDGYYDCDDPAYTFGDLCCTSWDRVIKAAQ